MRTSHGITHASLMQALAGSAQASGHLLDTCARKHLLWLHLQQPYCAVSKSKHSSWVAGAIWLFFSLLHQIEVGMEVYFSGLLMQGTAASKCISCGGGGAQGLPDA